MTAKVMARGGSRPAGWRSKEKRRRVALNGDSYFVQPELQRLVSLSKSGWLFAVADGLGGEGNDDIASQTAVAELGRFFEHVDTLPALLNYSEPSGWLRAAYDLVNRKVCDERAVRGLSGMYTTLTSALLVPDQDELCLYTGNIGDSRLYLLRDHILIPLTRDDGEDGFISRVVGDPNLFHQVFLRYTTILARTEPIKQQILMELERTLRAELTDIVPEDARPLAPLFLLLLEGVCPVDLAPAYSPALAILFEGLGAQRFHELVDSLAESYNHMAEALAPIPLQVGDRLFLCSDGISNAFGHDVLCEALVTNDQNKSTEENLESILDWLFTAPGRVDDDRTGVLIQIIETA